MWTGSAPPTLGAHFLFSPRLWTEPLAWHSAIHSKHGDLKSRQRTVHLGSLSSLSRWLARSPTHLLSSLTHTHCIFVTVALNAERTPVLGQIPSLQLENGTNCLSLAEFFLRMTGMKCFYKSMFMGRRWAGGFCRNWQIRMLLMVEKEDLLE